MAVGSESSSTAGRTNFPGDHFHDSRAWRLSAPAAGLPSSSMQWSSGSLRGAGTELPNLVQLPAIMSEFTSAWEHGEGPSIEAYLDRLDPADFRGAVELIYRDYCLAAAAGQEPDSSRYLQRFPRYAEALERVLGLHEACSPSLLGRLVDSAAGEADLPDAGDDVGPYFLRRELGRGSFARVFLAEQVNLENRLVVVKVATRPTREPWLLARVRHTHIVEIVSHALVGEAGLHLICMPFWGGATLSDVLDARRGRGVSGRDLVAELDSVAAPEFPVDQAARPAREILAGSSYNQAIAWIGARLAEALDYAFSRGVVHGDVKPSNILLSADGNPRLLDFNLARDNSELRSTSPARDLGGTLAYMAPERLRAFDPNSTLSDSNGSGSGGASCDSDRLKRPEPTGKNGELDGDAHRADVYALGMVLLETLIGPTALKLVNPVPAAPDRSKDSLKIVVAACAAARSRSARLLIREAEAASGRTIPPGLRVILERALDPDPARRYLRGSELAEDLARWRSNRPLAFTIEPFWQYTVPSSLKRWRRPLVAAAVILSLVVGLPSTALITVSSRRNLIDNARNQLERQWDDAEVYRIRRSSMHWHEDPRRGKASFESLEPNDPSALEAAVRALKYYGVLEPGDWRRRDDVRFLPDADREELELWLMEQAFRYCLALSDRPDSPADWQRARDVLNRLGKPTPIPAFTALGERLNLKLGITTSSSFSSGRSTARSVATRRSVPSFSTGLTEYLMGVAAECDLDDVSPSSQTHGAVSQVGLSADDDPVPTQPHGRVDRNAARALGHYRKLLSLRPDSYWGHYRAASACYAIGSFAEAARHLERCLAMRPNNAAIRGYRAACLAWLERYSEALEECDQAVSGAPDVAELFRTRAFIRAASGQTTGLIADLQRFDLLGHFMPRRFPRYSPKHQPVETELPPTALRLQDSKLSDGVDFTSRFSSEMSRFAAPNETPEVDLDDLSTRYQLAVSIRKAGKPEVASAENAKILVLDPEYIPARVARAREAIERHRFGEAERDLNAVLDHPHLTEYLRKDPTLLRSFHQLSRLLSIGGRVHEGQALAQKTLDLANALQLLRSESHYSLAQSYAMLARNDRQYVALAADELWWVFVANPSNQVNYYVQDKVFDAVREQINAALRLKPDPIGEHERLVEATLARAH
jgi:eukaryotic-like serine/threonine-protein kinase